MTSHTSAFPAIFTYILLLVGLFLFSLRHIINSRKTLIAVSTFLFIASGFIIQVISINTEIIKYTFDDWKNTLGSPPITVLATASGIFIGNTVLRRISQENQRREVSILYISGLNAHIKALSTIAYYFEINNISAACIETYLTTIRENKIYEKALADIGKFRDNETDILSKYESHFWTTMIDIERHLKATNIPIEYSRLKITATIIYAMLCCLTLSRKHWKIQANYQEKSFIEDFSKVTQWLSNNFIIECSDFIRKSFIEVLLDVREQYQSFYRFNELKKISSLIAVYLPLSTNKELVIFGTSHDKILEETRNYLKQKMYSNDVIEEAILQSKFEIISPWN